MTKENNQNTTLMWTKNRNFQQRNHNIISGYFHYLRANSKPSKQTTQQINRESNFPLQSPTKRVNKVNNVRHSNPFELEGSVLPSWNMVELNSFEQNMSIRLNAKHINPIRELLIAVVKLTKLAPRDKFC